MNKYLVIVEHLPSTIFFTCLIIYFTNFSIFFCSLCFFFGWLIDIDHLIDYFFYKKKFNFDFDEFIFGNYFKYSNKVYIPFHSYEISFLIILLSFIFGEIELLFISMAHMSHLLQDQFTNKVKKLSYFFVYRCLKSFNLESVCK